MTTVADIKHSERAHSEIGASSATRWMNCPASVSLSRDIPDSTSEYAKKGTAAHELSEYCFENDCKARDCLGMEFEGVKVHTDMADHVQFYLDEMEQYTKDDSYDVYIEEKFHLKNIHEDMFGSNDFCAMGNKELIIADFKYGKGINVEAEKNLQLIIYALGAYYASNEEYDFRKVKLVVVQPRIEGGEWSEWNITVDELLEYEAKLKEGVARVYQENPDAKTGDHCRFCKAKPTCKTIREKTEDIITQKFDEFPVTTDSRQILPMPETLSVEQISKILTHSSMIEDWLKSVSVHAHGLLENGEKIEGYKLVKKRSNRKVKDEPELVAHFKDEYGQELYRTQLKTLGKLEALVGKEELAPFLIKPDTGNQIAPVKDKRPEVKPKVEIAEEAFEQALEEDFDNMDF